MSLKICVMRWALKHSSRTKSVWWTLQALLSGQMSRPSCSVVGFAVSGPEKATSGLAKLLPVERQPLPDIAKYCRLNSQVNNPKARQKSTPGDLWCRIFTSCWTESSTPVVVWRSKTLCASLLATTQRNTCIAGENRPPTAISGQIGTRDMVVPAKI